MVIVLGLAFLGVLLLIGTRVAGRRAGGTVGGELAVGNFLNLKLHLQAAQQERAIETLTNAEVARGNTEAPRDVLEEVRRTSTVSVRRVLWVDDNPDNNVEEMITLQLLGASIAVAVDTQSAARAS